MHAYVLLWIKTNLWSRTILPPLLKVWVYIQTFTNLLRLEYFPSIYIVLVYFKWSPSFAADFSGGVFTGRLFKEVRSSKLKLRVYILDKTNLWSILLKLVRTSNFKGIFFGQIDSRSFFRSLAFAPGGFYIFLGLNYCRKYGYDI